MSPPKEVDFVSFQLTPPCYRQPPTRKSGWIKSNNGRGSRETMWSLYNDLSKHQRSWLSHQNFWHLKTALSPSFSWQKTATKQKNLSKSCWKNGSLNKKNGTTQFRATKVQANLENDSSSDLTNELHTKCYSNPQNVLLYQVINH